MACRSSTRAPRTNKTERTDLDTICHRACAGMTRRCRSALSHSPVGRHDARTDIIADFSGSASCAADISLAWTSSQSEPAGRSIVLGGETSPVRGPGERIEQRTRLRKEQAPGAATLLVRGGPDTVGKLRRHAERTARAWALDSRPLFGISVFAILDMPLDDLLRRRFTSFRAVHMPTVGRLAEGQFELLPPGGGRTSPSGSIVPTTLSWTGC